MAKHRRRSAREIEAKPGRWLVFHLLAFTILASIASHYIYSNKLIWPPIRSDGDGYYAYLPTLLIHKKLDFGVLKDHFGGAIPDYTGIHRHPQTGNFYNKYPIGVAVLMVPFFGIAHALTQIAGLAADGYSDIYQYAVVASAVFYYCLGAVFLFRFLNNHFSFPSSLAAILLVTYGTNLFHYVTYDAAFSHVYSFAFVSILIFLTARFWKGPTTLVALAVGVTIGTLFLIRNYNLIYVLFFLFYGFLRTEKQRAPNILTFLVNGAGFSVTVLPQILFWLKTTGQPFAYSYPGETFSFASPQIIPVLFKLQKGALLWSPCLAAGLAGLCLALRSPLKKIALPSLIILGILTYIIAAWWAWGLGVSYGHRGFIDAYPLFAIGLAYLISAVKDRHRWTLGILLAGSVVVVLAQMHNYWIGKLPGEHVTWQTYQNGLLRIPKQLLTSDTAGSRTSSYRHSGLRASGRLVQGLPEHAEPGKRYLIRVKVTNVGPSLWLDRHTEGSCCGEVNLGVIFFPATEMQGCARPLRDPVMETRIPLPYRVAPGDTVELEWWVQTPGAPGDYVMLLEMVSDGVAWFTDLGPSPAICQEVAVR